jgi:hypothetical protein
VQTKKLILVMGVLVLLVSVASFIAGRMFNNRVGIVGFGGPMGGQVSISLDDITPAPELPVTKADVTGLFVESKDNTIVVQDVSFGGGSEAYLGIHPWMRIAESKLKLLSQGRPLFTVMLPSLAPRSMAKFTMCSKRWKKVPWMILIRNLSLPCGVAPAEIGSSLMCFFTVTLSRSRNHNKG